MCNWCGRLSAGVAAHARIGGEYRITCTLMYMRFCIRCFGCWGLHPAARGCSGVRLPILVAHLGLIAAVATGGITTVLLCYFIVYAVHLGVVSSD